MHTLAEENYLKAIHRLSEDETKGVSTNDIAARLETKASSVTDMVKKLADKKLVNYQKYKGVILTEAGRKVALRIMRKHRLWEVFLVDKLQFKWHEVHEIAEQLEHIQSTELTIKLDQFLGFPRFDPHGDPIPDEHGQLATLHEMEVLAEMDVNAQGTIVGVKDSSDSFLRHLESIDLVLGRKIKIIQRFEYDDSMQLELPGKTQITVTGQVGSNLLIQPL